MKKKLLFFICFSVLLSNHIYSQLSSPILVLPPAGSTFISTTVTLDWEDVTDATGYLVDIATTPIFPEYLADSVNATSSQFSFAPGFLATNQTYYWRVTAHNSYGFGAPSEIRTFRTAGTVNEELSNAHN